MYDFVIAGAGPSGATLARLIGSKYKVLLLERRKLLSEKGALQKCCGGLLAPDAQKMLAALGLGIPRDVLVGPQLFTVRTIDRDHGIERFYQRHYINMDREKFDRYLVSLIPPQVEVRDGCVLSAFEETGDGVTVRFQFQGKEFNETCRFLIGADGAFSLIRRRLFGADPGLSPYIAIQERFPIQEAPPYFSVIFDREITDFYSWTIPKEDCLVVGAALLPRHDPRLRFSLLKERLALSGEPSPKCTRREGAFLLRPRSTHCLKTGRGRIALAGEAAGFISPTSAEGLSYAFKSALALSKSAGALDDTLIARYSAGTARLRKNIFFKILKVPFMYNRALRKLIMRSGITCMEIQESSGQAQEKNPAK